MRLTRDQRDCGEPPILSSPLTSLLPFFFFFFRFSSSCPFPHGKSGRRKCWRASLANLSLVSLPFPFVRSPSLKGIQKMFSQSRNSTRAPRSSLFLPSFSHFSILKYSQRIQNANLEFVRLFLPRRDIIVLRFRVTRDRQLPKK